MILWNMMQFPYSCTSHGIWMKVSEHVCICSVIIIIIIIIIIVVIIICCMYCVIGIKNVSMLLCVVVFYICILFKFLYSWLQEGTMQFCLLFRLTVHISLCTQSMKLHHASYGVWPSCFKFLLAHLSEWVSGWLSEWEWLSEWMSENTMAICLLQMSFPFCNFSSVHPCWRLVADSVEVLASFKSLLKYQEISEVCRTLPLL